MNAEPNPPDPPDEVPQTAEERARMWADLTLILENLDIEEMSMEEFLAPAPVQQEKP